MDAAPGDEGPIGPVPEPGDEEDDEDVADGLGLGDARSTEGDVEVVSEPGGEGDVPTPPELGDVAGEVGELEVGHQLEAEELGGADGDVGVPGEVPVDLEGEEDGPEDEGRAGERLGVVETHVDVGRTGVGHDDLLEHAPEDEAHAVAPLLVGEGPRRGDLRQQVGGPLDGARDELREEGDEGAKGDGVAGGLEVAPIDVDGVGEGLEGVEGDADGQDDLQGGGVHGDAEGLPGRDPVLDEEVGVLEVAEDAEVDGEGHPQPPFLPRFVRRFFNADADEEVDDGGEGNQPEEAPVPPPVEDIRRNEQQEVLRLEVALGDKPIQPKDNRQKKQKLRAVEEHLPG